MQKQSYNDSCDNTIISFLSEKLIEKIYKFNVKVTSFNYNSSSVGLFVTRISGTPINIEEVHKFESN